jgi:hypothetical protein
VGFSSEGMMRRSTTACNLIAILATATTTSALHHHTNIIFRMSFAHHTATFIAATTAFFTSTIATNTRQHIQPLLSHQIHITVGSCHLHLHHTTPPTNHPYQTTPITPQTESSIMRDVQGNARQTLITRGPRCVRSSQASTIAHTCPHPCLSLSLLLL